MSQIEISCIGQTAIFTNTPEIFSGDVGVDTVKFTFDELWDSYRIKTAVFYNNSKETYTVILDENNVAVIPEEVMTDKCKLNIGVFGTNANGDVKTSKIVTYHIGKGAISNDLESPTTTPDLWVQILARQTKLEADVETIESIAKGCNKALAYTSYAEMIDTLNAMGSDELIRGQNIYIGTVGVPDLWVYSVETENVEYTYVDDLTFVENMDENTTVQVGYFKLAQLETQEVDIVGLETDYNSVKSDVEALERTIGYVKSKNLIPYPYPTSTPLVDSGLTWTYDSNGIMTINGKASNNAWFNLIHATNKPLLLKKGKYILSGCAIGGSSQTYRIELLNTSYEILASDMGNGCEFTLEEDTNIGLRIYVFSGTTMTNVTFKPMIRPASIEDDTYEPYVADVQTQLDNYEVFDGWAPNATTYTGARCYYIKTKKMLTVYFCFYPNSNITSSAHYVVCSDVKKTFGVDNFRFGFNTCYNSNNKIGFVTFDADANILKINRLTEDLNLSYAVYGQISCFIENWN